MKNIFNINGDTICIYLPTGDCSIIDKCNLPKIIKYTWRVSTKGRTNKYAIANTKANGKKTTLLMHHALFGKPKNGFMYDHIDHNGLNNKQENIRLCTASQNNHNKRNNNKFHGVIFYKPLNKYLANITHNGKTKHLGYFNCPVLAAYEYDIAAKKIYGSLAYINFK